MFLLMLLTGDVHQRTALPGNCVLVTVFSRWYYCPFISLFRLKYVSVYCLLWSLNNFLRSGVVLERQKLRQSVEVIFPVVLWLTVWFKNSAFYGCSLRYLPESAKLAQVKKEIKLNLVLHACSRLNTFWKQSRLLLPPSLFFHESIQYLCIFTMCEELC